VIGQHFLSDTSSMLDDERNTNSDIHEMFFVNELFKDDDKFDTLLLRMSLKL